MYHPWESMAAVMDVVCHAGGILQLLTSQWQIGSRGLRLGAGYHPQCQLLVSCPGRDMPHWNHSTLFHTGWIGAY